MSPILVLIIDDHALIRAGLREILAAREGIRISGEAPNGLEALRMIANAPPDVALVDISMPGMSGLELLERIHVDFPSLPVLMLSMHNEDQFAVRALKAGAAGYLTKDCTPSQLVQAIRRVAGGGKYITPAVADALASELQPLPAQVPHKRLSNREFQIFRMLAGGRSIHDIALELNLSANTVSTHKRRLMTKLGVDNNADMVRYAVIHQILG